MGKQSCSTEDNWRARHGSGDREGPPNSSMNCPPVGRQSDSTSSVSSCSDQDSRSSSSSSNSCKTSSSATQVRPTFYHHDCTSSHSESKLQGNVRKRRTKRIRTKSSSSTSPQKRNGSVTGRISGQDSYRRRSNDKNGNGNKPRANRADEDLCWRKKSGTEISSVSAKTHQQGKPISKTSVSQRRAPKNKPTQREEFSHPQDSASSDPFDFASTIFEDDGRSKDGARYTSNDSSGSGAKSGAKNYDKRSLRILRLSDERRQKEYLAYQPTKVQNLYSFGIDNKGTREPRKAALSKKEEDVMFRKRAIYMMHMEEQEKRRQEESAKREARRFAKGPGKTPQEPSTRLQKSGLRQSGNKEKRASNRTPPSHGDESEIFEERPILPRDFGDTTSSQKGDSEESTQYDDATSPMEVDCEKQPVDNESIPCNSEDEGDVSSPTNQNESESADLGAFHAVNVRRCGCIKDKNKNGKSDGANGNTGVENSNCNSFAKVEVVAVPEIDTVKSSGSAAAKQDERNGHTRSEEWRIFSLEQVVTDIVRKSLTRGGEHKTTNGQVNGEFKNRAETGSGDVKLGKESEEKRNIGRHQGLPRVLVDKQALGSGKADPAAKKNNIIRISPETVNVSSNNSNPNTGCSIPLTSSECSSFSSDDQRSSAVKACIPTGTTNAQEKPVATKGASDVGKIPAFILPKKKVLPQPIVIVNNSGNGKNAAMISKTSNVIPTAQDSGCKANQRQGGAFQTIPSAPKAANQGNLHLTQLSQLPILPGIIQCIPPNVQSGLSCASAKVGNKLSSSPVLNTTFLMPNPNLYNNHFLQNTSSYDQQRTGNRNAGKVNQIALPQNAILQPVPHTTPNTVISKNTTQMGQTQVRRRELTAAAKGDSRGMAGSPESFKIVTHQEPALKANTARSDQLNQGPLQKPQVNNYPVVSSVVAPFGIPNETQSLAEVGPHDERSQGLIGYINVPVIKDDHGRVVVILPNDQNIMETKQPPRKVQGPLVPTGSEIPIVGNHECGHAATSQAPLTIMQAGAPLSKPKGGNQVIPFETSTLKPGFASKAKSVLVNTVEDPSKPTKSPNRSMKSSLEECPGVDPLRKNKKENREKTEDAPTIKDPSKNNLLTKEGNSCNSSKDSETKEIPNIEELRSRQRAIASKLKELRNVRVIIAGQGRMEEDECIKMVNRLKEVEELFFRRLISTSTEMAEKIRNGNKEKTVMKESSSDSQSKHTVVLPGEKSDLNPDKAKKGEKPSISNDTQKKPDERIDKLFNTAQILRNCITALAKRKQAKDVNLKAQGVGERNEQQNCNKGEAKIATPTKEEVTSANGVSHDNLRFNVRSASTASKEQQLDTSIGSPQVDCFQPLPRDTGEEEQSNKIILRLQRIRSNNASPHISEDQNESDTIPEEDAEKTDERVNANLRRTLKIEIKEEECFPDDADEQNEKEHLSTEEEIVSNDGKPLNENNHTVETKEKEATFRVRNESETEAASQKKPVEPKNALKRKDVLFKGPSKEQLRAEEKQEREFVKQAWKKAFPKSTTTDTKRHENEWSTVSREQASSSSDTTENTAQERGTQRKNKRTRHICGNPTIRGNLTSIGSINIARQVGGSNETKFQWLLKQLQKKRNGSLPAKPKNQFRSQGTREQSKNDLNSDEEAREYVLLVSRGTQSDDRNLRKSQNLERKSKVSRSDQSREASQSPEDVTCLSMEEGKKKRGRDSTGSTNKPKDKLPRVYSPISDFEDEIINDRSPASQRSDELRDLIALREEVLSRQSSSSEDTIGYTDSLISLAETTRRVKGTSPQKKKLRSTGTMTMHSTNKKQSESKKSPCPAERRFATKTRGYIGYGWITSKVRRQSKKRGKKTKGGKPKKNTTPTAKAVTVISDDTGSESSDGNNQEKETIEAVEPRMKRRNTLASLSARLWDECYWSTLNDKTADMPGVVRKTLPTNNSPPSTRKTGLEAKMLEQWGNLLRYSGNCQDVETFPITVEELDNMNLPPAVANPMRVLLEGYEMAQQSTKVVQGDTETNASCSNTGLNENNSAEVRTVDLEETAQTLWDRQTGELLKDRDGLSSHDGITSSEWDSSRSTDLTLDTLTTYGSNDSRKTYHSSSAPQSPPALEAEVSAPSDQQPENNLRRWQTSQHLVSGPNGTGSTTPDYSADNMNSDRCHEEGDSARSGGTETGAFAGETSGWRIGGAGDLREPTDISAAMNPARNRRRQNRVISWYSRGDEQDDPDDNIPLARLIERERSAKTQADENIQTSSYPNMESNPQPNNSTSKFLEDVSTKDNCCDGNNSSSDSILPGPFILDYQTWLESLDDTKGPVENGNRNPDTGAKADPTIGGKQQTKKRVGKLLYADSKKGKSLMRKTASPSQESDKTGNQSLSTEGGKRYMIDCRSDDNRECHAFYRRDASPDVFE